MGDHMILQQNSSVKLWGWADNKKVTVTTSWNNQTYQVLTDKNGAWLVKVNTPGASYTPYFITISDGEEVILSDILIGEVWICSGQSNMDMRMMGNTGQPIDRSLETILHAGNYRNRIRFIAVSRTKALISPVLRFVTNSIICLSESCLSHLFRNMVSVQSTLEHFATFG